MVSNIVDGFCLIMETFLGKLIPLFILLFPSV